VLLLHDIRELFEREHLDQVSSEMIVERLSKLEHRPWVHFHQGGPITKHDVAKRLKPFGIRPVQVSVRGRRPNGYRLEQFKLAWGRYLPKPAKKPSRRDAVPEAKASQLTQ
jgi:Protein of unknown function (DUF3631)